MNTKLHAITDQNGRPLSFFMTAGQISDYTGAAALLDSLPAAQWMLGDRGYDADWFRDALEEKGIRPCIPGRRSRRKPVRYDKRKYKRRNRIEIMFGRLKDWRRVATRYDRCPNVFFSAICLAAAHLNHDPTSNRWRNLRALCQRRLTLRRRLALGDLFEGPYRIGMNLEAYETYYD